MGVLICIAQKSHSRRGQNMIEIEQEGLELLLSAFRHPVCDGNPLARQLFGDLNREWVARQAGETTGGDLGPLVFDDVNDTELKAVMGLMYGLSKSPGIGRYLMTVCICAAIFHVCNEELEKRQLESGDIVYH
jgi:hypothetical protein